MAASLVDVAFAGFEETRMAAKSDRDRRLDIEKRLIEAIGDVHRIGRELIQYEIANPEPEPLAGLIERFGRNK